MIHLLRNKRIVGRHLAQINAGVTGISTFYETIINGQATLRNGDSNEIIQQQKDGKISCLEILFSKGG
jgi:hypothetical protein